MIKTFEEQIGEALSTGGLIAGIGAVLAGICTFGYQVYSFLRLGEWEGMSIITALQWAKIEWAYLPHEWFGFYKVLDAAPLSLALILFGIIALVLGLILDNLSSGLT